MAEQRPERPPRKNGRPNNPNNGLHFGSQRGLFGWVLFIALAVLLFMLLSRNSNTHASIPITEFRTRLAEGKVAKVSIQGDEVTGEFSNPEVIPNAPDTVTKFRVTYPSGTFASGGPELGWILDHAKGAEVSTRTTRTSSSISWSP